MNDKLIQELKDLRLHGDSDLSSFYAIVNAIKTIQDQEKEIEQLKEKVLKYKTKYAECWKNNL